MKVRTFRGKSNWDGTKGSAFKAEWSLDDERETEGAASYLLRRHGKTAPRTQLNNMAVDWIKSLPEFHIAAAATQPATRPADHGGQIRH